MGKHTGSSPKPLKSPLKASKSNLLDLLLYTMLIFFLEACTSTIYITSYNQNMKPEKRFRIDVITGFPEFSPSMQEPFEQEVIWQ